MDATHSIQTIMATEKIYLIEADDLKAQGFIERNVETEKLAIMIWRVQFNTIRPLLGGQLYRAILGHIRELEENSTPIPPDYLTLLEDYIIPTLIPYVEMRATTHLNWKMRNKSVGDASDEHVKAGDAQIIANVRSELKADATEARNLLVRYLIDNTDLYPEYLERNCIDPVPEDQDTSTGDQFMFIHGGLGSDERNERGLKPGER